ncbi:Upstream stimulatory factor 2 [Halotydeus destructor]|nr:Upstream stimulatory factor 2 [Halotydeus destructor]
MADNDSANNGSRTVRNSGLGDTDGSTGNEELSGESALDDVTMLFPNGPSVVHLAAGGGNQHHGQGHLPIVGGPAIISATGFQNQNNHGPIGTASGPFYVVVPAAEMMSHNNSPRRPKHALTINDSVGSGGNRTARDEKRRATHNEVERRRRDKINNWIVKLAKVVPECNQDASAKQGQSKGGILAKACEHIAELTSDNRRLNEISRENEMLSSELDATRQQLYEAKQENKKMRTLLLRHGLIDPSGQSVTVSTLSNGTHGQLEQSVNDIASQSLSNSQQIS